MAVDIAPVLLDAIQRDFARRIENDAVIQRIAKRVKDGTAKLEEAHDYALRLGEALSASLKANLTEDALPDGKLYWNIANQTIRPMLENNHRLTNQTAKAAQKAVDEAEDIGLSAVDGYFPENRVSTLIEKASSAETFSEMQSWLGEPIVNTSESFFDGFVRANADFRSKSGMSPKIIRTAVGRCCNWCRSLAGTYDYEEVRRGSDVFRRHQYCRCVVTFVSGKKRQNVWSKKTWEESEKTLEQRKTIGLEQGKGQDVTPEYFGTATPGKGKITIDAGYSTAKHPEESKIANLLLETFGGDITLLNESNEDHVKTPDYQWNGKYWDLKTISTERAADSAIRHGLKQIVENPGGIILDLKDRNFSDEKLKKEIEGRMRRGIEATTDIMIISREKVKSVLRFDTPHG